MNTVLLSFLLDNINVYRDFENMETQYKVRMIDFAIRAIRQSTNFPWNLKKGTLRVFDNVTEYPIDSDHDELGYIDNQNIHQYKDSARFYNTSLQQFYEDVNSTRNLMADIWKDGTRFIGLNYKDFSSGQAMINTATDVDDYTVSDDASGAVEDTVVYKDTNTSIKFTVTNSADIATIVNTTDLTSDTNYLKKYHFRWVYLDAVPTSIEMQLRTDASNYLYKSITTQFAGNAFVADDWNLIAYDLNEADEIGTFDEDAITAEAFILVGAASGSYRAGPSYLREWKLLDKWYYSKNNVVSSGASSADKQYFIATTEDATDIDTTDSLLGDSKWLDHVLWKAMRLLLGDLENATLLSLISKELTRTEKAFNDKYPNMTPIITTKRYRFNNDPQYNFNRYDQ